MTKKISKFRFKQFDVSHHRSSMKVGVDGVLIGCWARTYGSHRILDVGTGCGLIALILAQRVPGAMIDAIDIDAPSIDEATENVEDSPWSDRIRVLKCPYSLVANVLTEYKERYDLIISNPPFFDSGVKETITAREKARHQGELSPLSILEGAKELLSPRGSVAMVVTGEIAESLETHAMALGYTLEGKCLVRGHDKAPYKRTMLQWRVGVPESDKTITEPEFLTLEQSPGIPTEEYRALCKDFYLRF